MRKDKRKSRPDAHTVLNRARLPLPALALVLCAAVLGPAAPARAQLAGESFRFEDPSPETAVEIHDPLEGWNRAVFGFNDRVYRHVFNPGTKVYNLIVPKFVQKRVNNVFSNIALLRDIANQAIQTKFKDSAITTSRFIIYSTVGVGGIFRPAWHTFPELENEDFGQTLAVYGAGEGSYLVLPLLGPSTTRDMIGGIVDLAFDPLFWLGILSVEPEAVVLAVNVERGVNNYAYNVHDGYDSFMRNAIEPYVSMRDAYVKFRRNAVTK